MRAFVLGGGGNLGPLQVGALRALLENGITPDFIVGCSVGALNAIQLAQDLSLRGIDQIERLWSCTTTQDIYPGNSISRLWRVLKNRDSLYDNRTFYRYLERNGFGRHSTFGDISTVPVYITATHLQSGQLRVFGNEPNERILDAAMATTAIPPLHPPWEVDGEQYIDGSTTTPLPLRVAVEHGATEIYALRVEHAPKHEQGYNPPPDRVRGTAKILESTIRAMMRLQAEQDLSLVSKSEQIQFHQVILGQPKSISRIDFSQSKHLMQHGYNLTRTFLAQRSFKQITSIEPSSTKQSARVERPLPMFSQIPSAEAVL